MTLPAPVPPTVLRAWERRTGAQRDALEVLLLGKQDGEWGRTAEWLSIVLRASGDSVSATTIRTYRRAIELMKELTT